MKDVYVVTLSVGGRRCGDPEQYPASVVSVMVTADSADAASDAARDFATPRYHAVLTLQAWRYDGRTQIVSES